MSNDSTSQFEGDAAASNAERETVLPPRRDPPPETSRPTTAFARRHELFAVLLAVVLADITIYRSAGFAGFAVFLVAVLPLIVMARPTDCRKISKPILALMTLLVLIAAARTLWLGSPPIVLFGLLILVAWTRTVCGSKPFVLDTLMHAGLVWVFGFAGLPDYRYLLTTKPKANNDGSVAPIKFSLGSIALPIVVTVGFGILFVLANPDLSAWSREWIAAISEHFADLLGQFVPDVGEVIFWGFAGLVVIGLVRPITRASMLDHLAAAEQDIRGNAGPAHAHTFLSFRNTLIAVTILFAVYLTFEFLTLWRRDFPDGFYYAGYAHAGAAWLTVALAAASTLLSAMFRGSTLLDPRLPSLKKLAWVWSLENFLLAAAVINRLLIYVDFNGMTRMRTVGFLGVAAVMFGLVLVIIKIAKGKGFIWLIRGDLAVLAIAVLTYVLLPVDRLVHAYNTRQILSGHLAPSVQITEHPHDLGGSISLIPLLKCKDPIIRDGVAAALAAQAKKVQQNLAPAYFESMQRSSAAAMRKHRGSIRWTAYQLAEHEFLRKYEAAIQNQPQPSPPPDAWDQFRTYAFQWY